MENVVIVEAVRTAVGKFGGSLTPLNADDLAVAVMEASISRSGIDSGIIDNVIMGHCRQSSDLSNIARFSALKAGIPEHVPANAVMCACASGMYAAYTGYLGIATEEYEVALVGGTESMSNAIYYLSDTRWGLKAGSVELKDSLTEAQFNSQPQDLYGRFNMGMTAENVAEKMNITREEQDQFSLNSQKKAAIAIKNGRFKDEIVPVIVPLGRKKEPIIFDTDEHPRLAPPEKLASLKPIFKEGGTVTAGNSSGRNDGASALLLMSESKANKLGLKPLAIIKGMAQAGVDPRYMGLGPVVATEKVLAKSGLTLDEIDLIELNEAFAAQSIGCIRQLGLENQMDKINVNGGAIALGHPIGSSGSRIIVTLIHEMRKRGSKYGLATLCVAGGMGMSAIIEAV